MYLFIQQCLFASPASQCLSSSETCDYIKIQQSGAASAFKIAEPRKIRDFEFQKCKTIEKSENVVSPWRSPKSNYRKI